MRPRWYVATLVLVAACSESAPMPTSPGPSANVAAAPELQGQPEPHVFLPRGQSRIQAATSSPDMTWHGGTIIAASKTYAIYWGSTWTSTNSKVTGMTSFFQGWGGSNYAGTSTEYAGSNGQVTGASSYLGSVIDNSSAPKSAPRVSSVISEVCKWAGVPDPTALYIVYATTPRGHANYCAYHTWGSCNGNPVQAAWVFDLDGDPGCDPQDSYTGHSQGLAAIANVTAHELSETITDPRGSSWYDASGAENGDKCAWTFNVHSVTFSNSSIWHVQGEWSNKAYDAGTGYPNRSGQKGCLDGS